MLTQIDMQWLVSNASKPISWNALNAHVISLQYVLLLILILLLWRSSLFILFFSNKFMLSVWFLFIQSALWAISELNTLHGNVCEQSIVFERNSIAKNCILPANAKVKRRMYS